MWAAGFQEYLKKILKGFGGKIGDETITVQQQNSSRFLVELKIENIRQEFTGEELFQLINPPIKLLYVMEDVIRELNDEEFGSLQMAEKFNKAILKFMKGALKEKEEHFSSISMISLEEIEVNGRTYSQLAFAI